jgi:hypothetical protein
MGYYDDVKKDYKPSMDASRFSSSGPSPISGGFSVPDGMFSDQNGAFSTPRGTFMPDGSKQQDKAIAMAAKRGMPNALNPDTPPIKSASAPLDVGQPYRTRGGGMFGADLSLSPRLYDPGFSLEMLSGRMGMI